VQWKFRSLLIPQHYRKILRNLYRIYAVAPIHKELASANTKSAINDYEYCATSQHGEDGILDRIFSAIGFRSRIFVEFGFHPAEANALLLLYKMGFSGLFIDADSSVCALAAKTLRSFAASKRVQIVNALLTPDTTDAIFAMNGISGDIDLLSIDVDSIDFWLWNSIRSINPRVVIIETTRSLGLDEALTQALDAPRKTLSDPVLSRCQGASPLALKRLGDAKGYRFIGVDSSGVNMFFIRSDIECPDIPASGLSESFARCREPAISIEPTTIADAVDRGLLIRL
jgi:hypothetical protein